MRPKGSTLDAIAPTCQRSGTGPHCQRSGTGPQGTSLSAQWDGTPRDLTGPHCQCCGTGPQGTSLPAQWTGPHGTSQRWRDTDSYRYSTPFSSRLGPGAGPSPEGQKPLLRDSLLPSPGRATPNADSCTGSLAQVHINPTAWQARQGPLTPPRWESQGPRKV